MRYPAPVFLGDRDTGDMEGKIESVGESADMRSPMGIVRFDAVWRDPTGGEMEGDDFET